jgi:hypothetical protein
MHQAKESVHDKLEHMVQIQPKHPSELGCMHTETKKNRYASGIIFTLHTNKYNSYSCDSSFKVGARSSKMVFKRFPSLCLYRNVQPLIRTRAKSLLNMGDKNSTMFTCQIPSNDQLCPRCFSLEVVYVRS